MTLRFFILVSLFAIGSGFGQISVVPAVLVEDTKYQVFQEGRRSTGALANFRLHLDYYSKSEAQISVGERDIALPLGEHRLDLSYEHLPSQEGVIHAVVGSKELFRESVPSLNSSPADFVSEESVLDLGGDFTAWVRFKAAEQGSGTLLSKCRPGAVKWVPDAKALFIRNGRLVYDIGWVGALAAGPKVTDGQWHEVVLICAEGQAELYLDGRSIGKRKNFSRKDKKDFVFKIGKAASDFAGDLQDCEISGLRYWSRAVAGGELSSLVGGELEAVNTPDLNWSGQAKDPASAPVESFSGRGQVGIPVAVRLSSTDGFEIKQAWVQPLEMVDHAEMISNWSEDSLHEGRKIYQMLCVTCHGDREQEGSIPMAMKFHSGVFKNGSDPYRIYQTLDKGYGMMVAQPQYSPQQKYALIHYIREEFLRSDNREQCFEITDEYLASLPKGLKTVSQAKGVDLESLKPYEKMDFGPALMWTYQVDGEGGRKANPNIAQKGINIRLDAGPGGVSKGDTWMIYETDTMRVAAAYHGDFVDWRGIAFDGSHGSHTRIVGETLFTSEDAPAWQNPKTGSWQDDRIVGRDGRRYGPMSEGWIRYRGMYYQGDEIPVLHYQVGEVEILERPGLIDYGDASVFTRTLNVDESAHDLVANLAPNQDSLSVLLNAPDGVRVDRSGATIQLHIPAATAPAKILLGFTSAAEESVAGLLGEPADLFDLTQGGASRFAEQGITVTGQLGAEGKAFAVDTIPVPNKQLNRWNAWMRLGGFDFFSSNPDRAAVCTWLGDVWLVDGVSGDLSKVTWRRICTGLFQPLGLKIVDDQIYVTCRDQIARLHDLNGDDEIDYVECFNHHPQVTEHFHEFAMGLQTDEEGNFYYAKSARHAKKAVVPHHGTLLRVSPDGKRTDIVATGFRAANGVCVNPDGTWIVTDQEGHWNPKNRINYVREGGFYGNMFGYHDVTDESDAAMDQPLCWITNAFDRSPAELVWVPEDAAWGSLNGRLLNLSYGYGQIYTVPHEVLADGQAQGGMCALPIDRLPTGIHRGRFHPENGQLYGVGMFAWAGSQKEDGGFFRVRATGKSAWQPVKTQARDGKYVITFSDELPKSGKFTIKTWDLKRTERYGSKHFNEKELTLASYTILGNQVTLVVPDLRPTMGMEIRCEFSNGIERVIHSSIHSVQ